MAIRALLILTLTLFFTACAVGPDYVRPSAPVPAHYKEANKNWKIAEPKDTHDRGAWWTVFRDPQLNALAMRVAAANQNVAIAEAQYRQAVALASQARAAFFPGLGASANITRQQSSSSAIAGVTPTVIAPINEYAAAGTASWELDLWGAVRRQVESSNATVQSDAAQVAAERLSMQSLLVQNYFQLRALDKNQKALDDAVVAYQKALKITEGSLKIGVAALSDVAQAQTQLKVAQAQAIDNQINRAQLEHAIAVLIGLPPTNLSLPPKVLALQPPSVPLQIPSVLLERRPDIAQAERAMAAANAQIGVAIAAYFPTFTLVGSAGYQSNSFARWFIEPARFWSVGPQLAATLFDGGLLQAKTAQARAQYDQAVATYRQTILAAFQNVEDNLVAVRVLAKERVAQKQAVAAAELALKLALDNYKSGTIAYTAVIVAQTALYAAQQNLIAVEGRQMVATAGLIAALGGGWNGVM